MVFYSNHSNLVGCTTVYCGGMSTVSEVLAAVHANLEVLAISLVTNVCVDSHGAQEGDSREVLEEVLTVVENKKVSFLEFITKLLQTMSS